MKRSTMRRKSDLSNLQQEEVGQETRTISESNLKTLERARNLVFLKEHRQQARDDHETLENLEFQLLKNPEIRVNWKNIGNRKLEPRSNQNSKP